MFEAGNGFILVFLREHAAEPEVLRMLSHIILRLISFSSKAWPTIELKLNERKDGGPSRI